jgi:hypothetical protein
METSYVKNAIGAAASILGLFLMVVGYLSNIVEIFKDPLYTLWVLSGATFLLFLSVLETNIRRKEVVSNLELSPKQTRTKPYYSVWVRAFIGIVFIVSAGLTINFYLTTRSEIANLATVSETEWFSKGVPAGKRNGMDVNFVEITDIDFGSPMILNSTSAVLKLNLTKAHRYDWVMIERIEVEVLEYESLEEVEVIPRVMTMFAPHLYFVEIDDPENSKSSIFRAEHFLFPENEKGEKFANRFLDSGKPEPVWIRLNAKTPGFYTVECRVYLSHNSDKQVIRITKPTTFLFDFPKKSDGIPQQSESD